MGVPVWLSLGSNMGDRRGYLLFALQRLTEHPAIELRAVSSLYVTEPWGVRGQEDYFNIAVAINTTLSPHELLAYTQSIENASGRQRTTRWGARQLDIDIILFGEQQIDEERLQIPHPRFRERLFVLRPLYEISGDMLVPSGQHLAEIINRCDPNQRVELKYLPEQWLGEIEQ